VTETEIEADTDTQDTEASRQAMNKLLALYNVGPSGAREFLSQLPTIEQAREIIERQITGSLG
jgi:hypothetical protein